jgi:antitoxin YefM
MHGVSYSIGTYNITYARGYIMKVLSYSEARQNFARTLDAVVDDAEETVIHRAGHEPVVIISLSEWNAMKETQYLLSDPANAAFLRRGIEELNAGRGEIHELIDPDTLDQ